MHSLQQINQTLDRCAQPRIVLAKRSRSAFRVCGVTGYSSALVLSLFLTWYSDLSLPVLLGVAVIGAITFFALAFVTKVIVGRESLIYYHHEIAVMLAAALGLWLAGQPVLSYLDITILGLGTFLACGRVGCFMVGCCHGRPHHLGVCYGREHAEEGFPPWFVNVRLFPIQLVESFLVLVIVMAVAGLILTGAKPGDALAWYVVAYGVMRFALEFARGDAGRPYWIGFSEAQWTSLVLMTAGTLGQWTGLLTVHRWHFLATVLMALAMVGIWLKRRREHDPVFEVLQPDHLREIAVLTARLSRRAEAHAAVVNSPENGSPKPVPIASTSLGINISSGSVQERGQRIDLFGFSRKSTRLSQRLASVLANLICRLRQPAATGELVTWNGDVYHLLIRERRGEAGKSGLPGPPGK